MKSRRRKMVLIAGFGTAAVAAAAAAFSGDDRDRERISAAHTDSIAKPAAVSASAKAAAESETSVGGQPAPATVPAPVPVVLTRADSVAIAKAVRERIAKEEAARGSPPATLLTDSITAMVRRIAIDSIIKATLPAGTRIPVWSERPPAVPAMPLLTTRRVIITIPRSSRNPALNEFARSLSESIRRDLSRRHGYDVVDLDSVQAALNISRVRTDVERMLKPDIMISPSFVGMGDTMTVLVTLRDLKRGQSGTRIASGKFRVDDPEPSIPAIVKLVAAQLDNLSHTPAVRLIGPTMPIRPGTGQKR